MLGVDRIAQVGNDLRSAFNGHSLNIRKRDGDWWLTTSDGSAGVSISTFWRLRDSSRILIAVDDDGHHFGLPEPVEVEAGANAAIERLAVKDVVIDEAVGDLCFAFDEGLRLEVIVTSAGHECWQAFETVNGQPKPLAFGCSGGGGFRP